MWCSTPPREMASASSPPAPPVRPTTGLDPRIAMAAARNATRQHPSSAVALVDAGDFGLARRVVQLVGAGSREERRRRVAATYPGCVARLDGCVCTQGCPTSWRGCRPSGLCSPTDRSTGSSSIAPAADPPARVAILVYLAFKRAHMRRIFTVVPSGAERAYRRELRRIRCFVASAKLAQTRLPIYAVVSGERNVTADGEALLLADGVGLLEAPFVEPPRWASSYHKLTFNKISALSFTQFDKVIVMDNDVSLLRNADALARAPTPGLVWHTACGFQLRLGERSAVTTGVLVLSPSAAEFARARDHLHAMYQRSGVLLNFRCARCPSPLSCWPNLKHRDRRAPLTVRFGFRGPRGRARVVRAPLVPCAHVNQPTTHSSPCVPGYSSDDGSDQEFWRSFYEEPYELPPRYHATSFLNLTRAEWLQVHVLHRISGFARFDKRWPEEVRTRIRSFTIAETDPSTGRRGYFQCAGS